MGFQKIGAILPRSIKRAGFQTQVEASMVCEAADKELKRVFGDKLGSRAKALYFKDNMLTLAILSSALAQEIRFRDKEIINNLNNKFGNNTIEGIRYLM